MATKDSIKKDEDEKKEEKPDTRGMYAKIAMIKNKLRSAGQRDPMIMGMDTCEETVEEGLGTVIKGIVKGAAGVGAAAGVGGKMLYDARKEGKKKGGKKYNPYGKGSNMNPTKASETTGP